MADDVFVRVREGDMMTAAFLLFIVFGAASLLYIIIGITINDVRNIRQQRDMRRHPNARRWRQRPVVTMTTPSRDDTFINAIRRDYRKSVFRNDTHNLHQGLVLTLPATEILPQASVRESVQRFNADPILPAVEILPVIDKFPQSVRELMKMHHVMLSAPFAAVRSGYGPADLQSPFIHMINADVRPMSKKTSLHRIIGAFAHAAHLFAFGYALYAACFTLRPELLVMYLGGFVLWTIIAIGSYPHASFARKLSAVVLLPVSGIYFAYRLVSAPFLSLRRLLPEMV